MTTTNDSTATPPEAVDLMAALKASLADAEWGQTHRKCRGCTHPIFQHDRTDDAVTRNCRDCDCDRYARVF